LFLLINHLNQICSWQPSLNLRNIGVLSLLPVKFSIIVCVEPALTEADLVLLESNRLLIPSDCCFKLANFEIKELDRLRDVKKTNRQFEFFSFGLSVVKPDSILFEKHLERGQEVLLQFEIVVVHVDWRYEFANFAAAMGF